MSRKKSPVTQPGIDPGTFRLVAKRLNHYATPMKENVMNETVAAFLKVSHNLVRTGMH
jgi:hypothetical protein